MKMVCFTFNNQFPIANNQLLFSPLRQQFTFMLFDFRADRVADGIDRGANRRADGLRVQFLFRQLDVHDCGDRISFFMMFTLFDFQPKFEPTVFLKIFQKFSERPELGFRICPQRFRQNVR